MTRMSHRKSFGDRCCSGIAIYNFNDPGENKLKLTVGDTVCILNERAKWFFGYIFGHADNKGFFPKTYIHLKGDNESDSDNLPINDEISSVLREWGQHWKNLYVTRDNRLDQVKNQIYDLLNLKRKIVSGTLPVDELRKVQLQAAGQIDLGNKLLGLDLIVRDNDGNLIKSDKTSTIQLFMYHKAATERINDKSTGAVNDVVQPRSAIEQHSNIFLVTVRNFTCKLTEDAELIMYLYDAKEAKPITESYVVRWTKEGLMSNIDQMNNLKVMYTDLGKKDLEREKLFLVCNVVRLGQMESKEFDHRRSSSISVSSKRSFCTFDTMRRPCGVAAMDITSYLNGRLETSLDDEFPVPFLCCEKENFEQTLRKIIFKERTDNKNQSLFVGMKLLRGDLKQVREENPHLVLCNVSQARKMGFPEVILPGDARNDLYLTLLSGEFSRGSKTSDKNVEVLVTVCNAKGQDLPGVISLGTGVPWLNEYRSVVYYHEDKPQWHETFKITLLIQEFKTSYIKFTFKHRSSNEAKDRNEKPFGISYVRLIQENGVTLPNAKHNLVVYKIDYKKFDESSLEYLNLPSFNDSKESSKAPVPGLTASTKDTFCISTNICSTKLTQNENLLGLLNWTSHRDTVLEALQAFMKVGSEEVVKFLQDILDALFNILMNVPDDDAHHLAVFECLLRIVTLVTNDRMYQHFEPVLDLYIKESFSATLGYRKLISVLKSVVQRSSPLFTSNNVPFRTMKSLQYIMKFISRSRVLFMELYPDLAQEDDFEGSFNQLLKDIVEMMSYDNDDYLREQGALLRFFPSTISDILLVFDSKDLSVILRDLVRIIPPKRLTKQKMMTINEIVHSDLFKLHDCRQILLPEFCQQVKTLLDAQDPEGGALVLQDGRRVKGSTAKAAQLLGTTQHELCQHVGYSEKVELCIKILSDIMELLFRQNVGPTYDDLTEVIRTTLRSIVQAHIKMERNNPHCAQLVAVMLDIFRQMSENHYNNYISRFQTPYDILDFLMEILVVFKELVSNSVYPKDWCDMLMLQNSIILKALRMFSHTIRDRFFERFENDAWSNFFHCAIAFMNQEALQLQNFSVNKRTRILNQYNDMRREMGLEVKSMWINLCKQKIHFVPSLVGLILEMTLIPEPELREQTIPIFFDMMQCEFYSSRLESESFGDTKRDSSHIKACFSEFENEMIVKLDALLEGGKGDDKYRQLFQRIMIDLCAKHTTMRQEGIRFVNIVSRLMGSLLEYRDISCNDNKENTMSCIVNLLDFYSEINKKEMYIRYLNKLYDLHMECDNFAEAAFTLELHAKLLKWSEEPLSPLLKSDKYLKDKTHRQLKVSLYDTIINNFDRGKMWEFAIDKCKELAEQYEQETFEYDELSTLHRRLAEFYDNIMKAPRLKPEYFRVGYFGRGFPKFLQNKVFIYRGKDCERLGDFSTRITNEFSKAELLTKLTPPREEIVDSDGQYLQINCVEPVMDERSQRFSGKPVSHQIVEFYQSNNVKKFTFDRLFDRRDAFIETDNQFGHQWVERTFLETTYPLPGILRWFPVESFKTKEISPIRRAVETLEKKNKELAGYILNYNKDRNMQIKPLSGTLKGTLDANVMGGITNYEEIFFAPEYLTHHPQDDVLVHRLKDLIADQIPLLDVCIQIHKQRAPSDLQPLQRLLEERFAEHKAHVEENYGKRDCGFKLERDVTIRRRVSLSDIKRISSTLSRTSFSTIA